MLHELKSIQPYFTDVESTDKTFEVRYNDRYFQAGDRLVLKEYDAIKKKYSGKSIRRKVTYVLEGFEGVKKGYVVLGIRPIDEVTKQAEDENYERYEGL